MAGAASERRPWVGAKLTFSEQQATGLERFELLGKLEGVDVFDMKPLEMTRLGTVEDPIKIYSLVSVAQRRAICQGPCES